MHRGGLVREASYEEGWLHGVVVTGGKPRKVLMQVISRTHMENKCPCFLARRDGRVCAHAIAVGLEVIEPVGSQAAPEPEPEAEIEDRWPTVTEDRSEEGNAVQCRVMLPLRVADSWERGRLMVGIGVEWNGRGATALGVGRGMDSQCRTKRTPDCSRLSSVLHPEILPGWRTSRPASFSSSSTGSRAIPGRGSAGRRKPASSRRPLRPPLVANRDRVRVAWPEGAVPLVHGGTAWVLEGTSFRPVASGLPDQLCAVLGHGVTLDPLGARGGPRPARHVVRGGRRPRRRAAADRCARGGSHLRGIAQPRGGAHGVSLRSAPAPGRADGGGSARERRRREGPAPASISSGWRRTPCASGDSMVPGGGGSWSCATGRPSSSSTRTAWDALIRSGPSSRATASPEFAREIVPITPVFEPKGSGEDWFAVEMGYRAGEERGGLAGGNPAAPADRSV